MTEDKLRQEMLEEEEKEWKRQEIERWLKGGPVHSDVPTVHNIDDQSWMNEQIATPEL